MAGHGRGKKENTNKNPQAHAEWMKRKKLGRPAPTQTNKTKYHTETLVPEG